MNSTGFTTEDSLTIHNMPVTVTRSTMRKHTILKCTTLEYFHFALCILLSISQVGTVHLQIINHYFFICLLSATYGLKSKCAEIRGQNKVGPLANCPQHLVRAQKMLRSGAQMALKNIGPFQHLMYGTKDIRKNKSGHKINLKK